MTTLRLRPIDKWPREQTQYRLDDPFMWTEKVPDGRGGTDYKRRRVPYGQTLDLLYRELEQLGADEAVMQLAVTDRDIRVDGDLRADARPKHPGVVLTFVAPGKGTLTYACDRYERWQSNLRAIALGLEALRKVERYGIAESGEQYVGWKELPSGIPLSSQADELEAMSIEQASRILVGWVSGAHDLLQNARTAVEDADYRRYAYRQALKALHPDTGGEDTDGFLRLQRAMKVLDENDG